MKLDLDHRNIKSTKSRNWVIVNWSRSTFRFRLLHYLCAKYKMFLDKLLFFNKCVHKCTAFSYEFIFFCRRERMFKQHLQGRRTVLHGRVSSIWIQLWYVCSLLLGSPILFYVIVKDLGGMFYQKWSIRVHSMRMF